MKRALNAFHEWAQLRARVRDEHQFHLYQAISDMQASGLSARAAKRAARVRFGSRQHRNLAIHELGGDWAGLIRMFRAHRVHASPSFQPLALVTASLLMLVLSPAPRRILEGVAGQPLAAEDRSAVFISNQSRNLRYVGITKADFESIQSLHAFTKLERFQSIHAKAQATTGTTVPAIESLIRAKTGNPRLRVIPLFERHAIVMGPAKAVWGLLAFCSLFFVATHTGKRRWLGYGIAVGCLHALASLMAWALAIQLWSRTAWATDGKALLGFLAISAVYLGVVALQGHIWWRDLHSRCPVCLDILLLPLTEGSADCFLLNSPTTESVCSRGHGVLVETRWAAGFRPERSPLEDVVHG